MKRLVEARPEAFIGSDANSTAIFASPLSSRGKRADTQKALNELDDMGVAEFLHLGDDADDSFFRIDNQ